MTTINNGVWVVYDYDTGPYPLRAFPTGQEGHHDANQFVVDNGYGHVAFWPFNETFRDAVANHESAQRAKPDEFKTEDPWWDGEWETLKESIQNLIREMLPKEDLSDKIYNHAMESMRSYSSQVRHTQWQQSGHNICEFPFEGDFVKVEETNDKLIPCPECWKLLKKLQNNLD